MTEVWNTEACTLVAIAPGVPLGGGAKMYREADIVSVLRCLTRSNYFCHVDIAYVF